MRAVVSVATGRYVAGLDRLTEWCAANSEEYMTFRDRLPMGSPSHKDVPFAFKAYALTAAATACDTLLWADACILPIKPLDKLWERIERDGYWIGSQAGPEPDKGYTNYEWTADSAYLDLFPQWQHNEGGDNYASAKAANRDIPHVVATTFGLSIAHPTGRAILDEYFRLASTTKAFCGPWTNAGYADQPRGTQRSIDDPRYQLCGPPDVRGHRHDQSCLSVIAWRLGCKLTRWPEVFAYRGHEDERTILVADSAYWIKQ